MTTTTIREDFKSMITEDLDKLSTHDLGNVYKTMRALITGMPDIIHVRSQAIINELISRKKNENTDTLNSSSYKTLR